MSREILFRGKDYSGEWVYGDFIHDKQNRTRIRRMICQPLFMDENGNYHDKIYAYGDYIVDPDTVSEFTGLRDKNGTRVFEGDIVNLHYFYEAFDSTTYGAYEAEKEIIAVIEFGEMGLIFESEKESGYLCEYLQLPQEELEVIGNKWDNADLLEGDR